MSALYVGGALESQRPEARVHERDWRGGSPQGVQRTKCGVFLGERSPRVVEERAAVTCTGCLAAQEVAS